MKQEFDNSFARAGNALCLGDFDELVFDDEPLEPLLEGIPSGKPTPADAMDIWRQGIDRSAACARALITVLANNKTSRSEIDVDSVEACLRGRIEAKSVQDNLEHAANCLALARLLHMKDQQEQATAFCWKALDIQEACAGFNDPATQQTALELRSLLLAANKKEELARLRTRMLVQEMEGNGNHAMLLHARSVALGMVREGQYAEAETIYRQLLKKRFETASIHCHLARIYLLTDREAEARQIVEDAWQLRDEAPLYVHGRILFLRMLLSMLSGEDWQPILLELKKILEKPYEQMEWTMQPAINHLKPRLGGQLRTLLLNIVAAMGNESMLGALTANPVWVSYRTPTVG